MGSSLSRLLCCVLCERCREQEAPNAEPSETEPVLQSPGDRQTFSDTQPPTRALKIPKQGSKDTIQDRQLLADALEESGEPCSTADPVGRAEEWEAAWNPMDFFVAPTDEEAAEVEDLTQQERGGKAEEDMKAVPATPGTAAGAGLVAREEQPGTEGAPCAGKTLQEGNSLIELSSEDEPGQGCETEPPADTRGVLVGWDLSLCAVQVPGQPEPSLCAQPVEDTARAKAAETSPLSSISFLVETMSGLTLQSPMEVTAGAGAELYSTSAVFWKPLCPQWGSLQPPKQLLELLEQGMQDTLAPAQCVGSLGCAGLAGLAGTLQQLQGGALAELGQEGSRGCAPGPEAEHGIMQPAVELPEEPAASVPVPVKKGAELPHVPPELPGRSGEMEAENVEA